jgi:acetylornithine deacetylase/succinyl-diaminopimelate desuccinylase-like protein
VHNPLQALSELIAAMHDEHGRVTLPGYYDQVVPIDEEEHQRSERVPVTEDDVKRWTGAPALWGEPEYNVAERVGARPTLEINGIWGGYTGEGSKTVIPAEAHAKISMRLVPDQDPNEVRMQLETHLTEQVPTTITWELNELAHGKPFICDPSSEYHRAFAKAQKEVWGKEPVLARIGGSVPVARDLQDLLGIPSILTGFALPDDQIHSPNESQDIESFHRGVETVLRFLYLAGDLERSQDR